MLNILGQMQCTGKGKKCTEKRYGLKYSVLKYCLFFKAPSLITFCNTCAEVHVTSCWALTWVSLFHSLIISYLNDREGWRKTIDHNLSVEEDYLFVKGVLHVLAYTVIIRYPFIYVSRKNFAYNVNHFCIKNCNLCLLQRKRFIHPFLMLSLIRK